MPGVKFNALTPSRSAPIAAIAAGFTGLLSLFNIGGRFFWASLSDYIGRKNTYYTFFMLGIALYALGAVVRRTSAARRCSCWRFCIILSMYGGGFATVPAYLADMFGTQFVGAIHGRLLTAWSTAGIIGPVVVNYIREYQLAAGVPRDQVYDTTMYILCGMLVAGLICNYLIKPVDPQVVHERRRRSRSCRPPARSSAARPTRLVRHRQGRTRRYRPRCSGPSSAFRSPGASWKTLAERAQDSSDATEGSARRFPSPGNGASPFRHRTMSLRLSYGTVRESPRRAIHVVRVEDEILEPREIADLAERMRERLQSRGELDRRGRRRARAQQGNVAPVRQFLFGRARARRAVQRSHELVADRARLSSPPVGERSRAASRRRSEQPDDLAVRADVDRIGGRHLRQARHGHDLTADHHHELGAGGEPHLAHG